MYKIVREGERRCAAKHPVEVDSTNNARKFYKLQSITHYTLLLPHNPRAWIDPLLRQCALNCLNLLLLCLLLEPHLLLNRLLSPLLLPLQLIRSADRDILRPIIAKCGLQPLLNNPASDVVEDHGCGESGLEVRRKGHQAHLLVDLGDKFRGARESDGGDADDAPVHTAVFGECFAEGTALVVDGERGDLLDKLEKIHGAVQQGFRKFAFEINVLITSKLCQ